MEEVKVKAWIARDEDSSLFLYINDAPERHRSKIWDYWNNSEGCMNIPNDAFPQVQWSDEEPTEVELTIKIKQ